MDGCEKLEGKFWEILFTTRSFVASEFCVTVLERTVYIGIFLLGRKEKEI